MFLAGSEIDHESAVMTISLLLILAVFAAGGKLGLSTMLYSTCSYFAFIVDCHELSNSSYEPLYSVVVL